LLVTADEDVFGAEDEAVGEPPVLTGPDVAAGDPDGTDGGLPGVHALNMSTARTDTTVRFT
jgi:hypothetical protein